MAEQRYEAVRSVIADGETVKDVAARYLSPITRRSSAAAPVLIDPGLLAPAGTSGSSLGILLLL